MIAEHEQRVLDPIDAQQQEVVDFLRELLAFKTITPDEEVVEHDEFIRHQEFVKASLGKMGFGDFDIWEVDAAALEDRPGLGVVSDRDLSNMPVLVGRLPGAGRGRSLILNGHHDVVPLGFIDNRTRDPFAGEIADGRIYGRGTNDKKGGIAAIITEPTNMKIGTAVRGQMGEYVTVRGRAGHAEQPQPHFSEGGAVSAISKAMRALQGLEEATEQWRTQPA